MKSIIFGAAFLLCAGSAAAYEPDQRGDAGPYVSARLGAVFLDADEIPDIFEVDTGFSVLGSLGYDLGNLKVEGEVGWRRIEAGPVFVEEDDIVTFFANAFYEFPYGFIRPYVGAGAGLSVVHVEANDGFFFIDETESSFAYQIIGGLAIPLTVNMDLVTDYRFMATEGLEFGPEAETHNITGGVRINF